MADGVANGASDEEADREEQRTFWDGEASRFDEEPDHGLRDPEVRAGWGRLLADHLPPPPADVLDLGCGTGTLTLLLADQGFRVHGVDLSPRMVEAARTKLAGTPATVEVGDAAHPPGEPHAYDVVLTRHVLWALPDPAAAVGRWVRRIRPGGRLVLVEGRWWTGGGLTAEETRRILAPHAADLEVVPLPDPTLWGGPVEDERYLVRAVVS